AARADQNDDRPPEPKVEGAGSSAMLERIAAIVDDTVLLESEVASRALPLMGDAANTTDEHAKAQAWRTEFRKALDQMVEEQLIIEAATEAKLEVNEDEVQKALDSVKSQNKLTDQQLEAALAQQGTSVAQYKKEIRRQILRLRAINVLVRPRVSVSD